MKSSKRRERVAYVLRRFPKLSESFVLNEILAVEAQEQDILIFSLMPTRDPRFHEDLSRLKANVYYVPDIFDLRTLLRHNVRTAKRNGKRYFKTLAYVLRTLKVGLIWRFLQSGYIADKAQQVRVGHFHAHFSTRATSAASLASKVTDIPYSFTAHAVDIYKSSVERKVLEKKIADARFVVTVSDCNRKYLQAVANGGADRIVRIYNGIDMERFCPDGAPPPAPFTILTVARLVEKKGLPDLVKACAYLAERSVPFRCWIIGRGRERARLNRLITALDLKSKVYLLGAHTQIEIARRYRSAHLFVLPCRVAADGNRDGLPVSIVEALASGLPVVSTPVTGIPEVVHHEYNGLIVPECDPRALADAIEALITRGDLYRRLSAQARDSVSAGFDAHGTGRRLGELFQGSVM